MRRLGYEWYGAVGSDAGSTVSPRGRTGGPVARGRDARDTDLLLSQWDPAEFEGMTEGELAAMAHLQWFHENVGAFGQWQGQQPQTLVHAPGRLADSTDRMNGQFFGDAVDIEFALANMAIYWFTGPSASSARFYYENAHSDAPTEPTTVPLGLASFAVDFMSIRRLVGRDHKNVVPWHEYTVAGHYPHQTPDVLIGDLRGFYGNLLADRGDA
jgi:epoxide hydrolase